jgi:predicted Zn-ribbon and HTH transcriptional regulator
MTEVKPTQGPWRVVLPDDTDEYGYANVYGPGRAHVAAVWNGSTRDVAAAPAIAAANARLIAAAPDMAAALDAIHALLDRQNWGQRTLVQIAAILEDTGREIRPAPLSCYQCGRPTDWPTPDSRCPACTRYTPEQV